MTNSTDKPQKKKGPFRFEAIIPVIIVFALGYAYFSLFFDANLRKAAEWTGTYVHGAEVNIKSIRTSFWGGSFRLRGLQITDKNKPSRNMLQIGEIRFQFLWDALLRAKFVVNDAAIENIQALAPRKSPGYVAPPAEGSPVKELEENVLAQTQEDFSDNFLGDVANIAGGSNVGAQLKDIQGELKAEAQMKELEKALKEKEALWNERIKNLPQKKQLDALVAKAKTIKLDGNNPAEFAKNLKKLDQVLKQGDKILKEYNQANKDLNSDLRYLDKGYKEIDQLIKQDIADLQKRFKIPTLDTASFSKNLFGRMFSEKLVSLNKYKALSRQFMPSNTGENKKQPEIVPHKRGQGKDFKFPVTKGYPLFWLQKAIISSEPSESEYSGKISGEAVNFTTNPPLIGKPAEVKIKGDFPKQGIYGLDAYLKMDHTTDTAVENLNLKIASYPVGEQRLSNSKDVTFNIRKSTGDLNLNAELKEQNLNVKIVNLFKDIDYQVDAQSKIVSEILKGVAQDIPVVDVNARASGAWTSLKWNIKSNLGDAIAQGFKKQVDAQIKKAQAQLKAVVDEKILKEKQKLDKEIKKLNNQLSKTLDKNKKEVENAKKVVQNDMKQKEKSAKKKQGKQLEKAGKKLLKGLGL